jgi:hypothetical protein
MGFSKWLLATAALHLLTTSMFAADLVVQKPAQLQFVKVCPILNGISFNFPNNYACGQVNKHELKTLLFKEAKACTNLQDTILPKHCTIKILTQADLELWPQRNNYSETMPHYNKYNSTSPYYKLCLLPDKWFLKGTCTSNNKNEHWKMPFTLSYPLEGHAHNTPPELRVYKIP